MLYQQIAQNKRNTWIILGLFGLILILMSWLIAFVSLKLALLFLIGCLAYIVIKYFTETSHLLAVTNAKQISKQSNPELYEMVEELCLAANLPMPKVYIANTPEVNAYATGFSPQSASLVLYQGLLDLMNKNEVQGVIGHELSHIRNYDIRVTTLSGILVSLIYWSGIGCTIIGFKGVMQHTKGLITLIFEVISVFILIFGLIVSVFAIPLAKLLYLMMSRQREYLADAGSVDLTREPSGLISGLKKIKQLEEKGRLPQAKMANNLTLNSLYFNLPPLSHWWQRLFADHPPLSKRIQRLKDSAK